MRKLVVAIVLAVSPPPRVYGRRTIRRIQSRSWLRCRLAAP